jgi:hypothetical protein
MLVSQKPSLVFLLYLEATLKSAILPPPFYLFSHDAWKFYLKKPIKVVMLNKNFKNELY